MTKRWVTRRCPRSGATWAPERGRSAQSQRPYPGRDRSVLDLQENESVRDPDQGEEDGGAVEIALDHRAAANRATAAADAEGAREPRIFARVEQDEEDHDDGDDYLDDAEKRVHGQEV
jgi:hypothetical protein